MTPAPGPVSTSGTLSSEATSSGALASSTTTRAEDGPSTRPTASLERVASSSSALNLPKLCATCGSMIEAQLEPISEAERATGTGLTAPSPSSIAFATNPPQSTSSTATAAAQTSSTHASDSITAMLANTPAVQEVMQLDQQPQQLQLQQHERPQLCSRCIRLQEEREQSQAVTEDTRTSLTIAMDDDEDSDVTHVDTNTPSELVAASSTAGQAIEEASSTSMQISNTNEQDTSSLLQRTPSHPWRRQAPWAHMQRAVSAHDGENAESAITDDRPPLTISVGQLGAGGDALSQYRIVRTAEDDVDFPPLARSPSANSQIGSATSPRLPLSPTRSRVNAQPSTSSPGLGRQASFSRSQASIASGASAQTVLAPVVNVPATRGRVRATSSSSNVGGAGNVPSSSVGSQSSGTSRGRRPSGTRRLSRSGSSQGPTAVSFAGFGDGTTGSPLVDDLNAFAGRAEATIEEHPFGPNAMTRPRLSTLPARLASSERKTSKGQAGQGSAPDVYWKPFSTSELQGKDGEEKERLLIWFNSRLPDPRADISRLRSISTGRGCLFPGATFRGTQKSGRMSYDVTVQIVNVDLAASHLGGYLNIRGLTDDWPELTTYFDAEIIGQRYGFITDKWGATEADDMKHWGRFTPFRPIRSTLTRPGLRFNHMNKPYVFMRWKERFLVPDHRVRDINGASFAGFYYVCVELGEDATTVPLPSLTSPASPISSPGAGPPPSASTLPGRRASNADAVVADTAASATAAVGGIGGEYGSTAEGALGYFGSSSSSSNSGGGVAHTSSVVAASTSGRMSGFYFHEHSEPYQQLTLRHVAESSSTTFEMR